MTNREMLKEAIADAKALKETAIANAKLALEETFEPAVKSMLSAKLEEMEKEEDLEEGKKEEVEEGTKAELEEVKELEELEDLEEGEELEDLEEGEAELEEAEEDESEEPGEDEEEFDIEDLSEEELKAIIEDVIEDMIQAGELEPGESFEEEGEEDLDNLDSEEEGELEIEDDTMLAEGRLLKENHPSEVFTDAELDMASKMLMNMFDKLGLENNVEKSDALAKYINSWFEGLDFVNESNHPSMTSLEEEEEMKENEELEELRKELQEVNLLNSKLLYANKIFRTKNLQEHQKRKVLESFDEAQTVKEAKLVYETLISTLNAKPATKTRKPIRESIGRASSPINSLANKTPIVELAPEFVRMQELAGIKKVN